ncbi:hypothetical protein MYX76_10590 [Desulfobacterota bacterium AH_259_B03_O07]|nr:hypothetical protein [Desulfobacterota bacterium AH_259_B03_O07]
MVDIEDLIALERLKIIKKKALEEEKAKKAYKKGKSPKSEFYRNLVAEAKKILNRKETEPLRESFSDQYNLNLLYKLIKEDLASEWKGARNNPKKKREIIYSYLGNSEITLTPNDLLNIHNVTLAILGHMYSASESSIKRALRNIRKELKKLRNPKNR